MENTTAAAGKKRKLCHEDEEAEEDDNDEEKMEEFFALIKSIREARARLMTDSCAVAGKDTENSRTLKRKVDEVIKPVEVWKPTFQREDFLEEGQIIIKSPPVTPPGSSQSKQGIEKEDIKEDLDLRLSL